MAFSEAIRGVMVADVEAAMTDQSAVLEFRRQTATGTCGVPLRAADVAEEGILATADLEWVGRLSDFPRGAPGPRDGVKLDGTRYWVVSAQPDDACVTLLLKRGPEA